MVQTTYLPSPLTNIDSVDGLKSWLDREMEMMALHARSADIDGIKTVNLAQGETIEEHTISIQGLQTSITTIEGDILSISATLTEETLFRISADEALALRITSLQAEFGSTIATIRQTDEVRASENAGLAIRIGVVEVSVTDALARITTIESAYIDEDEAIAIASTTVETEFGDHFASAVSEIGAWATQATAYAWHTIELNADGYVSGTYSQNDGGTADITFLVDTLKVAKAGVTGGTAKTFLQVGTNQDGTASITIKADVIEAASIITGGIGLGAVSATSAATSAGPTTSLGDGGDVHITHTKTLIGNEAGEATVLITFTGTYNCTRDPYDSRDVLGLAVSVDGVTKSEHYIYPVEGGGDSVIATTTNFTTVIEGLSPGSRDFEILTTVTPLNNSGGLDDRYAGETCTGSNFTLVVTELKR